MTLHHLNLLHFSCFQKSTDTDHGEDADGTCVRTPETCQDSNSHTHNGEERGDPERTHVTPLTGARLRPAQQRLQHRIPASPPALWGVLGWGHATPPQTTPTTTLHASLSASMAPSTAPADLVEHWQRIQQHVMDREVLTLLALLVQKCKY